jgi:integrase
MKTVEPIWRKKTETAARTGEVIGATWAEIDFEARLWTITAGRMKGANNVCRSMTPLWQS